MANDFLVSMDIKGMFVDRNKLLAQYERDKRRRLGKIGAFIRSTVRRYILRRSKNSSEPGKPPKVHSRDSYATLRNVLFGVDLATESVIIGSVGPITKLEDSNRKTVPELMEFGGYQRLIFQRTVGGPVTTETHRYQPRPFMAPALDRETQRGTLQGVFVN